jgi:SAM-dependent methyltransferase
VVARPRKPPRDETPGADRRSPRRSSFTYAVRAPLARWLPREAKLAHDRRGPYRVLDIGCGAKPYYPFFAPYAADYVGVDLPGNPDADLEGPIEDLPVASGSFDLVLCTQVLEHTSDPPQAVRELARVVAPGGRVLASTHGVQVYHPSPEDLWRWTHAGLERLFRENGAWASVNVRPGGGTAACVGMLFSFYVDRLVARTALAPIGRGVVAGINRTAEAIDARSVRLRSPGPGTLFANYHVTADAPV